MLRHWRIILFLSVLLALGITQLPVFTTNAAWSLGSLVAPAQPRPQPASLRQATGCTYWVRRGDNLFRIGLRHGVSYTYLAALNGIPNPNLIYAGSELAVPCGSGAVPAVPANCAPSQTYTVVKGDNLFRIAYTYKTDLNLVRGTNRMYGRVLRPGMTLTIPCPGSVAYREVPPVAETPGAIVVPSGGTTPAVPPPATMPAITPVPPGPQIIFQGNAFNPATLEVLPGTTVTWVNQDTSSHTFLIGDPANPAATSNSIPPGGTFSFTFADQGIYNFQLKSNASVNGSIQVRNP